MFAPAPVKMRLLGRSNAAGVIPVTRGVSAEGRSRPASAALLPSPSTFSRSSSGPKIPAAPPKVSLAKPPSSPTGGVTRRPTTSEDARKRMAEKMRRPPDILPARGGNQTETSIEVIRAYLNKAHEEKRIVRPESAPATRPRLKPPSASVPTPSTTLRVPRMDDGQVAGGKQPDSTSLHPSSRTSPASKIRSLGQPHRPASVSTDSRRSTPDRRVLVGAAAEILKKKPASVPVVAPRLINIVTPAAAAATKKVTPLGVGVVRVASRAQPPSPTDNRRT